MFDVCSDIAGCVPDSFRLQMVASSSILAKGARRECTQHYHDVEHTTNYKGTDMACLTMERRSLINDTRVHIW
jgi:hypothetical protein